LTSWASEARISDSRGSTFNEASTDAGICVRTFLVFLTFHVLGSLKCSHHEKTTLSFSHSRILFYLIPFELFVSIVSWHATLWLSFSQKPSYDGQSFCFAHSWELERLRELEPPVTLFVKTKDGNRTLGLLRVSPRTILDCYPHLHCVQRFIQLRGELGLTVMNQERRFGE
jgi:hypothetical protein